MKYRIFVATGLLLMAAESAAVLESERKSF